MLEKIIYQIAYLLGTVMKISFEQLTSFIHIYGCFISLFLWIWTGYYHYRYSGRSWILNTVVLRRVHTYFVPLIDQTNAPLRPAPNIHYSHVIIAGEG